MPAKRWIQVYSGNEVDFEFDYEHPEFFNWPLESVAHHLAMLCRYTGAPRRFYSVAEHCVRVALYAADTVRWYLKDADPKDVGVKARMAGAGGLVHDATEMVCGDVNSPLKSMAFMAGYKNYEESLHPKVAKRFDIHRVWVKYDGRDFDVVHNADVQAREFERVQLLGKPPRPWVQSELLPLVESNAFKGELGMHWEEAEAAYLDAAKILGVK